MNFSGLQHAVQQGSHRISTFQPAGRRTRGGAGLSLPYKGSMPSHTHTRCTCHSAHTPHHQEPAQGPHLECRRLSNVAVFWAAIALVKYSITAWAGKMLRGWGGEQKSAVDWDWGTHRIGGKAKGIMFKKLVRTKSGHGAGSTATVMLMAVCTPSPQNAKKKKRVHNTCNAIYSHDHPLR